MPATAPVMVMLMVIPFQFSPGYRNLPTPYHPLNTLRLSTG
jgi:hypothetical protein